MSMVILSWIAQTGYLLQEPQQNITNPDCTEATLLDQVQDTTVKTGIGEVIPSHNLIFTDIAAQVGMTHTEAAPGHDIGIIAAIPAVTHDAHAPHTEITDIDPTATHHTDLTADHPHIEVPQLTTPEIGVDSCSHPSYKSSWRDLHRSHSHSSRSWGNHTLRRTWEWK